jgi:hypothetical protein
MAQNTRTIENSESVIDSRDVIARINYLESDEDSLDEEEREELAALRALAEEASGSPDWQYGETLIRDSYFTEYAQELAEDIGAINKDAGWPNSYIDWDAAADALKMDYSSAEFDGVTYWIRS